MVGYRALGCSIELNFPYRQVAGLRRPSRPALQQPNPFALVTLAHLLTQATRQDINAPSPPSGNWCSCCIKRGWDKQQVIDLFSVLDWMMRLPEQLKRSLWHNIEVLEEQEKMRYVTSVEQLCCRSKWMQRGWCRA